MYQNTICQMIRSSTSLKREITNLREDLNQIVKLFKEKTHGLVNLKDMIRKIKKCLSSINKFQRPEKAFQIQQVIQIEFSIGLIIWKSNVVKLWMIVLKCGQTYVINIM